MKEFSLCNDECCNESPTSVMIYSKVNFQINKYLTISLREAAHIVREAGHIGSGVLTMGRDAAVIHLIYDGRLY